MSPFDKRLLLRIALRMERLAKERYEAAGKTESAKSTRDNEMGDVLDLRDYVERQEAPADGEAVLLPKVPNAGMKDAGAAVLSDEHAATVSKTDLALDVYSAMVDAARPGEVKT